MSQLADAIEQHREDMAQRWADPLFATGVPESVQREDVIDSFLKAQEPSRGPRVW